MPATEPQAPKEAEVPVDAQASRRAFIRGSGIAVAGFAGGIAIPLVAHGQADLHPSDPTSGATALAASYVDYAAMPTGGESTDTANLQYAIDKASRAGGGTIQLGRGVYVAKGLVPKSGVHLRGTGRNSTKIRTTSPGADLFEAPTRTNGIVFEALSMQSVGGGNVFSGGLSQTVFRDCGFFQDVDDKCVFDMSGWIDVLVSNCDFAHTLTATAPTFRLASSVGEAAAFTFDSSRFTNTGNYAIWLEGKSGAFCHNATLRNLTFEVVNGGAVNLLSCKNARIDTCGVHDLSATTSNHLLNIGKSGTAGARGSESTIITGWSRDSAETELGVGLSDINIEDASDTIILGAVRYPSGTLTINLNSHDGLVVGGMACLSNALNAVLIGPNGIRMSTGSGEAARPSASLQGAGFQYFDIGLGKPLWSDGTHWNDALGVRAGL